jgi:hypothetical protein
MYDDLNVTNESLGAVGSVNSVMTEDRCKLISNNDIILFEYYVNDVNSSLKGKFMDSAYIEMMLSKVIQMCKNKKLLFILLYHGEKVDEFLNSDVHKIYMKCIKKFNISFIDCLELFKTDKMWNESANGYLDFCQESGPIHHNDYASRIIEKEVYRRIKNNEINTIRKTPSSEINFKTIQAKNFENKLNFQNKIFTRDYIEFNEIEILFEEAVKSYALEHIIDIDTEDVHITTESMESNLQLIQRKLLKCPNKFTDSGKSQIWIASFTTPNTNYIKIKSKSKIKLISLLVSDTKNFSIKLDNNHVSYKDINDSIT